MPRSGDLPGGLVGRASGLQGAGSAILFPGEVLLEAVLAELRPPLRDVPPIGSQLFSALRYYTMYIYKYNFRSISGTDAHQR